MPKDKSEKAESAQRARQSEEFLRAMRTSVDKMIADRFPGLDAAKADRDFERRCEKLRARREKAAVKRLKKKVRPISHHS